MFRSCFLSGQLVLLSVLNLLLSYIFEFLIKKKKVLSISGNASVEAAVNWVVEHENDPDIDEMPMV